MTQEEKLRKKRREKAAKLSKPRPVELPSGMWRCQIMVEGERISFVHEDPEVAHATILAMKVGALDRKKDVEERRSGNFPLSDAIDEYIRIRENVLSPSTIHGYKEIKKNRFPELMVMKVREITQGDIQMAVNEDAAKVGYKTISNGLGLVVSVLADYGISIDVKRIRMPQRKKQEHKFLEENGLIELFDAIRGCFAELPILLAVWLGLRRSEIMGLCWDCVNFETGKITIRRTYVKDKEKGYILRDEMKTTASRRTLDCPGYILAKLEEYQPDEKLRSGRIFRMHPNTPYEVLKDICKRNDIEFVGIHGLRHTNASVMMALGVMDKYIMAEGGWSTDYTMKNVYQHLFQSGRVDAKQKRDSFFGDISVGVNPSKRKELHTELHTDTASA